MKADKYYKWITGPLYKKFTTYFGIYLNNISLYMALGTLNDDGSINELWVSGGNRITDRCLFTPEEIRNTMLPLTKDETNNLTKELFLHKL